MQDVEYRWPIRALNGVAGVAEGLGLPLGNLDPRSIEASARKATGHQDWGDEAFREPLANLCDLVAKDPKFTPLARVIMRQTFIRAVSNRLEFQAFLKRHAEVRGTRIERPIFVLGFPRTGTTALQNLLCLHPGRRGLRFWELTTPVPWHEDPAEDQRLRIRNAARTLKAAYLIAPEQREVHHIDTTTFEECWPLFGNSFCVLNYDLQSGLVPYGDWLMTHDMTQAYREYKEYLQLLAWRVPADNLVLKCPEHLWFVDALLEVFPDACIVWTHRDPVPTIASYCSLISMQWRTLYGSFDPHVLGEHITHRFHQGVTRAMASRAKADPKRFFDVDFDRFVEDQGGTVREICDYFDLPWGEGMDLAVGDWLQNDRGDQRGNHKYSAERYGIVPGEVHERYADYIASFAVRTRAA